MIFFIALVENTRISTVWSKPKSSRMRLSGERYHADKQERFSSIPWVHFSSTCYYRLYPKRIRTCEAYISDENSFVISH
jgi:hypothetical protein